MKPCLLLSLLLAISTNAIEKPKPILERPWIGGEYKVAGRELRPKSVKQALYAKRLQKETPAALAGLLETDLIVRLNGTEVPGVADFYRELDKCAIGQPITLSVLRRAEPLDISVTTGRERYQNWHVVQFGFMLSTRFNLVPDRNFSLPPALKWEVKNGRQELLAPENVLKRERAGNFAQAGINSEEGWNFWLGIFGCNAHKRILSQEPAAKTIATAASEDP